MNTPEVHQNPQRDKVSPGLHGGNGKDRRTAEEQGGRQDETGGLTLQNGKHALDFNLKRRSGKRTLWTRTFRYSYSLSHIALVGRSM
jgi:hypothetical protein